MIRINSSLSLPENEIWFTATRSGGPGGQNVNKVNTCITLWFDVEGSPTLDDSQKRRIRSRLGRRVSQQGLLRIPSRRYRSQLRNRDFATERFVQLLDNALKEKPDRRATRPSKASREKRLKLKDEHSEKKRIRSMPPSEDG